MDWAGADVAAWDAGAAVAADCGADGLAGDEQPAAQRAATLPTPAIRRKSRLVSRAIMMLLLL